MAVSVSCDRCGAVAPKRRRCAFDDTITSQETEPARDPESGRDTLPQPLRGNSSPQAPPDVR